MVVVKVTPRRILLTKGQLFQPRPADVAPLPAWRVEAEILWNHTPLWVVFLAIVALVALLVLTIKQKNPGKIISQ